MQTKTLIVSATTPQKIYFYCIQSQHVADHLSPAGMCLFFCFIIKRHYFLLWVPIICKTDFTSFCQYNESIKYFEVNGRWHKQFYFGTYTRRSPKEFTSWFDTAGRTSPGGQHLLCTAKETILASSLCVCIWLFDKQQNHNPYWYSVGTEHGEGRHYVTVKKKPYLACRKTDSYSMQITDMYGAMKGALYAMWV